MRAFHELKVADGLADDRRVGHASNLTRLRLPVSFRTIPVAVPPRIDWTFPWMSIKAEPARSGRKVSLRPARGSG